MADKITELEAKLMQGLLDSNFTYGHEKLEELSPWTWSVVEASGIEPKVARGVIGSLVKKGLVYEVDQENYNRPDDMTISFTDKGIKVYKTQVCK